MQWLESSHADRWSMSLRQRQLRADVGARSHRNSGPRLRLLVLRQARRGMDFQSERVAGSTPRESVARIAICVRHTNGAISRLRSVRRLSVVTSRIDDRLYAVVSVNAFEGVAASLLRRMPASFDGEG